MFVVCPELSSPKPLDQSKNVTVRSYHKLSKDQNGQKKLAKKCQKEPKYVFVISTVRKLLDQSKNVTGRTYHKLSRDKNGPKKWSKNIKKCQKEPKYVSPYKYS